MKLLPQAVSLLLMLAVLNISEAVLYKGEGVNYQDKVVLGDFSESKTKRQAVPPSMNNATNQTLQDHHVYYTSEYVPPGVLADGLWFDISSITGRESVDLENPTLSNSYRLYTPHPLPFEFPYYGHIIHNVSVTTGGFLYASDFLLPEVIALTHNIAPLQADFNPQVNDTARVFIYSASDRFTVQWDNVHNNDHFEDGPFTFQVSLFEDGVIHFVYREIPLAIDEINNDNHPVEVGLSDSFYYDEPVPGGFVVRTVYEYSRIRLNATQNLQNSAYILTPVPNCVMARSCNACSVFNTEQTIFNCEWCPTVQRCSDGFDRFTQEWFDSGCFETATAICPISALSVGAVVGISVGLAVFIGVLLLVVGIIVMIYIGYKRPNSRLGLFLIEHRPKAHSLNKGSASYNVDSGKTILKEDLSS